MQSSKQGMWKGYHFSIEAGIRKGHLFREKWYIKGSGVGPRGGASLYKHLLSTSRGSNRAPSKTKTTITITTTTTTLSPAKISAAILRERMRIKNLHLPDETYRHWISSLHCSFQEYTKLGDVHPRAQERIKKTDPAEYSNMTNPHTFSRYKWSWLYENCVFLHK